jgi:16S rRNA (cytosine967-C5)-methyltransferase
VSSTPPLSLTLSAASRVVARVLGGESLTAALRGSATPAVQNLCYGTLRDYGAPQAIVRALVRKSVADDTLRALLLCALYELRHERRTPHTVVDEAVSACARLGHSAARGFVNAVLRTYLRGRMELEAEAKRLDSARHGYPQWWIDHVRNAYPGGWRAILAAGNAHPPMTLRVNRRRLEVEAYLAKLAEHGIVAQRAGATAVLLERPRPVDALPGFATGEVSVQDARAQLAAPLLDVRDNMHVLDACAAPGGKTAHLAEIANLDLVALDRDAARVPGVEANLARLGLRADVRVADAAALDTWWDGRLFDRVLLDAPCSASGVVRRHPDIKWLRRETDLAGFARMQARLLAALWRVLAPGGKLLYATCSIFPEENGAVVKTFIESHADAFLLTTPDIADGQLLPDAIGDGFYYARMQKI